MTTDHNWLNSEDRELQRIASLYEEIRRLYVWLGLMAGLSFLAVGSMAALTFSLKTQNKQLEREIPTLVDKAEIDRVKNLENRLNSLESQASSLNQDVVVLNQQVSKGLPTQLKVIKTDMKELQTSAAQFCKNIKY